MIFSRLRRRAPPRVFATFTDGRGHTHELIEGWRDRIAPAWRRMLEPPRNEHTAEELANTVAAARRSVDACATLLGACGVQLGSRILEVGCFDGARAFALAERTGAVVTAIDLPDYYVQQAPGEPGEHAQRRASYRLERLRAQVGGAFGSRVTFRDGDIGDSGLPDASFDAVVSWEVLEHLRHPELALQAMRRLLVPGGLSFHDYNPFFCIEGGHSLCTLDFPYGHALLGERDFAAYVQRFREPEAAMALRFLRHNLNRMTLADLRRYTAGWTTLALLASPTRTDLDAVKPETLARVRALHPSATLEDLLVRSVQLVLQA